MITDPTSGLRLMDRNCMKAFVDYYPTAFPEPVSIAHLIKSDKKVAECPVVMRERSAGVSSINATKSVIYMLSVLLLILLEKFRQ